MGNARMVANPANQSTLRFFGDAGLVPGMRVLDVGCGSGDLTRLIARLIGSNGLVLGIDRDEAGLDAARGNAAEEGAAEVRYLTVDLADAHLPDQRFDAIVGRRVLMYLPDPRATLMQLVAHLEPSGLVAFQEHAAAGMPVAAAPIPLHQQLHRWLWTTVAREQGDVTLGLKLAGLFASVGLRADPMRAEAVLLAPDAPSALGAVARAMLPRIIAHGVATAEDIDVATLDRRLEEERAGLDGAVLWDMAYFATARKES